LPAEFSPDLLRAQALSYDAFPKGRFTSYTEYFYEMLKAAVNVTGAKVVVIDDLAFLRRGRDRNGVAARFMRDLRELKDDKGLSILIIARTPSRATMRGTVTLADLEGSAEITGYADNIFAIGGSCADPSLRYLKQIKLRSCESEFDATNVPTFRIEKRDGNFLSFRHVDFEDERHLVLDSRYSYDAGLLATIETLSDKERTQREIADELRVSKTTVNRYLMIIGRQREERERLEYEEEQKRLKRQKPLTPDQERDKMLAEGVARDAQRCQERKAAEAAALGLPPPPTVSLRDCEPMTPSSVFSRPDPLDDKCDCFECGSGRPKHCLDKTALTSRSP
jgi:hypothetical protein